MADEKITKSLFLAVYFGDLERVRKLINKFGADVNALSDEKNKKGCTLLHIATKTKHEEITKLLIEYGANVNAKDETGKTPIFFSIQNSDLEITKLLLTNGANLKSNPELLNNAILNECIEIVEILLKQDTDINLSDKFGRTALHFTGSTVTSKYSDINVKARIAKLLLSKGANVNAQTVDGITTLHTATGGGYTKLVEALLDYNANVNSVDKHEKTPLHLSAREGNELVCKMLLNKGADVNAKQNDGTTALQIAINFGNKEVVELLLECGAEIDSKSTGDVTPLHMAARAGYAEIVKVLLKFGADINSVDENDRTAFRFAAERLDIDILRILKKQIVIMKTANLYVCEKNLISIRINDSMNDFQNECEEELKIIKSVKISNNNVSFYDIVIKNVNQLAKYARNENIVAVLKSNDYRTKFPIYGNMINRHFIRGMERKELLDYGYECFHLLFKIFPVLPYNCTEKIFNHLSNKELRIFIDSCKHTNVSDAAITSQ